MQQADAQPRYKWAADRRAGIPSTMAQLKHFVVACLPTLLAVLASAAPNSGSVSHFVVGGRTAGKDQFPSIVSVQHNQGSHLCGGTIIDEKYILTAAHCVQDEDGTRREPSEITVLAGTKDSQSGGVRKEVEKITVHENFKYNSNNRFLPHDLAILTLKSPLSQSSSIRVAPLEHERPGNDSPVVVAGWGQTDPDDVNSGARNLQYGDLKVMDNEWCRKQIGGKMKKDQLCARSSDGEQFHCSGDSGGPLYQEGLLVGVVSWAAVPCDAGPLGYSSVPDHLDWIRKTTGLSDL